MCNAHPPAPGDFCCALDFTVQPIFSGGTDEHVRFYVDKLLNGDI